MHYTFSCNQCGESVTRIWAIGIVPKDEFLEEVDKLRKKFSKLHINHKRGI